jgi:hypothetical protein
VGISSMALGRRTGALKLPGAVGQLNRQDR